TLDGLITTIAGNGTFGFPFDGDVVTSETAIGDLPGLAIDAQGNLFFADQVSRVRKISPQGVITTLAGSGFLGFSGDTSLATNARLANPLGVAVDRAGNVFIADTGNHRIRKIKFRSQANFVAADSGGQSFRSSGRSPSTGVGYAAIQPAVGDAAPSGL